MAASFPRAVTTSRGIPAHLTTDDADDPRFEAATLIPRTPSLLCLAFALLTTTSGIAAADEFLDFDSGIFATPFATTRDAARENNIPLQDFSRWGHRDRLTAGDSATILVTGANKAERKQWLIVLSTAGPSASVADVDSSRDVVLFTNTGHEISFTTSPVSLQMRAWGPFLESKIPENEGPLRGSEEARDTVNETFLRLGFARACLAMRQLHRARTEGRLAPDNMFSVGKKPFSRRDLEEGSQLAMATGWTEEDERAIAGTVPALMEYFDIAARSPGIRDLVWDLVEKPSAWSVVRRIGRVESGITFHSKGVEPVAGDPWALTAAAALFKIPFTLEVNGQPGLQCVLVVTQPQSPLLITAGIVGLAVQSPGDDSRRLVLRVIAARAAESETPSD